jgi:general secretion pathway protein K
VFRTPKEVQKGITTESKIFSIYADGVVPGRNRETRVRIHSVVDFRNAAELGATTTTGPGGTTTTPPTPKTPANKTRTSTSTPSTTTSSSQDDLDSAVPTDTDIMAALLSDPLGNIVYYRIE